jgi:hypothetical protein
MQITVKGHIFMRIIFTVLVLLLAGCAPPPPAAMPKEFLGKWESAASNSGPFEMHIREDGKISHENVITKEKEMSYDYFYLFSENKNKRVVLAVRPYFNPKEVELMTLELAPAAGGLPGIDLEVKHYHRDCGLRLDAFASGNTKDLIQQIKNGACAHNVPRQDKMSSREIYVDIDE